MDKNKALAVFDQHKKTGTALMYARREEIADVPQQYEPLLTTCIFNKEDFISMGQGNFYPPKPIVNQISDAAGVSFISGSCGTKVKGDWDKVEIIQHKDGFYEVKGDYGIIGFAQGYRIGPDGKKRLSSVCEYEFNVCDRVNLEKFMGKYPPNSPMEARKQLYEVKKFSTRRASTGAELAVCRELAGIPTAFKAQDLGKPMIFSQIIESNSYKLGIAAELMKTPDGRKSVASAMLGASDDIYGQAQEAQPALIHDVTPEPEAEPEPEKSIFYEPDETERQVNDDQAREALKIQLEEYLLNPIVAADQKGVDRINRVIDTDDIDISILSSMLATLEKATGGQND